MTHFPKISKILWMLILVSGTYAQVRIDDNNFFHSSEEQIRSKYLQSTSNSDNNITIFFDDAEPEMQDIDLNEKLEIIIEFKEDPYLIRKKEDRNADESIFVDRFFQLRTKLVEMQQNQLNKSNSIQPDAIKINKEFYKLFFGVSATVNRGMLSEINDLEYVKKLHYNKKIEAYLEKSISIIKADSVWNQFGVDGDSIIIAIIDSGIDYLHPALGGGFGAGFKVIGGYDFVRNDNDPIDDYGHGTHVAGIVAADGDSIKGVAPKALLYALKVLDQNGYGQEEDVIAAIEYCADPNGDGNLDDMVDIMNLSLGSSFGSPDAPSSIAIDNASLLGITACIAAGNNGTYKSIGTPGTAESAITVGASDDEDGLAYFSSKGPVSKTYSIKPDVVAPGVDINSLNLGGGTVEHSGTSMATPHVAGVCALLKSIHPEWGPQELKSAIMTTSMDIGEEVMAQGAGRIDALASANVTTTFSKSQLSFGLDDNEDAIWIVSDTIMISNHLQIPQTYVFQAEIDYPGININFYPSSITIDPNSEGILIVELLVNNTTVPYPDWGSLSYSGNILVSADENLHIPFAFVKSTKMILVSDTPAPHVEIFGPNFYESVDFLDDMYEYEVILPPKSYDILAMIFEVEKTQILVLEEIEVVESDTIEINFSEVQNQVVYNGVDEKGSPLEKSVKEVFVFCPRISNFLGLRYQFMHESLYFTNISDRYKISFSEMSSNASLDNKIRGIHHSIMNGINAGENLTNDPLNYVSREIEYEISKPEGKLLFYLDGVIWEFMTGLGGFASDLVDITDHNWAGEIFISEFKNDFFTSTIRTIAEGENMDEAYLTPPLLVWENHLQPYLSFEPPKDVLLINPSLPMKYGESPIFCDVFLINNFFDEYNFMTPLGFYGANNEYRFNMHNKSTLKLFDINNNLVISDTNNLFIRENLPEEYYRLEFTTNGYSVQGLEGQLKLISDFDLSNNDPIPPKITSFKFLDQNTQVRDHFVKNDSIKVYFSAADFEYLPTDSAAIINYKLIDTSKTKILSRINRALGWKEMDMSIVSEDSTLGFLYKTDLSSYAYLDSASIDLQLQFVDLTGNISYWTISPAFTVGKLPVIVDVEEIIVDNVITPAVYSLSQNYPNPFNPSTVISYTLPSSVKGETSKVSLIVYDVLGREVATLVNKEQSAGSYQVQFTSNNYQLTSGVYFYRLKSGAFVESRKMVLVK